jgi:hypothetical protein
MPYIAEEHRKRAGYDMRDHLLKLARLGLPEYAIGSLLKLWHEGLVGQLFNTHTDMRIERWIREGYEGLHPAQRRALRMTLADNTETLQPKVQAVTPKKSYHAANTLNAALAIYMSWLLEDKRLAQPYRNTPFHKLANELAQSIWNGVDRGHEGDMQTTYEWAERLGMREWFDLELPSEDDLKVGH